MGYQEWQQCIYFLEYVQGLTYFAWEPLCEGGGCLRHYDSVPGPLNIRSIAVAPCWSTGLICFR